MLGPAAAFTELSLSDWRALMAVNLEGAVLTMREAARHMIQGGKAGALVAISSVSAIDGTPGRLAYSASKAALLAVCRGLAVELARYRIRCNALVPGWIETDMLTGSATESPKLAEAVIRRTPVRRWGKPEDFEAVASFLADPDVGFHTGDAVRLDGGYSIY
jgi:NAD(P)-dependent dehydrogenase (short-subunit alcohol dehydrogenase family)